MVSWVCFVLSYYTHLCNARTNGRNGEKKAEKGEVGETHHGLLPAFGLEYCVLLLTQAHFELSSASKECLSISMQKGS